MFLLYGCPEQYVKPQQGPVNSVSASLSFLEMNPEISVFHNCITSMALCYLGLICMHLLWSHVILLKEIVASI